MNVSLFSITKLWYQRLTAEKEKWEKLINAQSLLTPEQMTKSQFGLQKRYAEIKLAVFHWIFNVGRNERIAFLLKMVTLQDSYNEVINSYVPCLFKDLIEWFVWTTKNSWIVMLYHDKGVTRVSFRKNFLRILLIFSDCHASKLLSRNGSTLR